MTKLDLSKYAELKKSLDNRVKDISKSTNTLLNLAWTTAQAGGDQYFPEPYPHLHIGGNRRSLFLAVSSGNGRGKNLIRDGQLSFNWKSTLESLPACAPWGNAMWEQAARSLDRYCGTDIINTLGKYNNVGITEGVNDLALNATQQRISDGIRRDAISSGGWRR